MHARGRFLALTLGLVVLCEPAVGQEWTRIRGPNGSGVSAATTVPVAWSDKDYNWMIDLPGTGHSSPVVWGERLFVTSADEPAGRRYLLCLDAQSGRKLWQGEFPFEKHPKHRFNTFAAGTPAVDAEHVYVVWQSRSKSSVTAFDHAGRQVWQYELGPFQGGHGPAASPIVHEELVIVCHDHEGPSYRVALDRRTGREVWKVDRPGRRACYSTPCVYRPREGPPQIICTHSYEGITSIDPASGTVNWEVRPFGEFQQRAIGSPVVAGDLVIGTSGFTTGKRNAVAVRPEPAGTSWTVEEVYRVSRGAPHIPTPLIYGGLMFLWDDRGIVTCVEAQTGETIWQKRIGGTFFGSPVCVDGRLYCIDRNGVVVVIEAGREFKLLARNELGEASCATPAVAGGVMYLRTESRLFSLGGK